MPGHGPYTLAVLRRGSARGTGARRRTAGTPMFGPWIDLARIASGAAVFAITWREAAAEELPAWE